MKYFRLLIQRDMMIMIMLIFVILPERIKSDPTAMPEQPTNDQHHNSTQNMINLHIIPHTHNDVGWLTTIEAYYRGDPYGCVRCILNDVTSNLFNNSKRKFSYAEMIYFKRWWNDQNMTNKDAVRLLIQNGQFEFINAGISANDEATTYYEDIIEQMIVGHRFIKEEFNVTTRVGWHIDSFGHSTTQASLFAQMGFDSFFFERINEPDFNLRFDTAAMEFLWKPNPEIKNDFILGHINYMKYYLAPIGCIDIVCGFITINNQSIRIIEEYVKWVKVQVKGYKTSNIMHHVGGDFVWGGQSTVFYSSLELVIDYLNTNPQYGIKAYFSTPSNYTASVYQELKKNNINDLATKHDDFFPYEDSKNSYWTGYYTSKSKLKYQIRQAGRAIQVFRKLLTIAYISNIEYMNIDFVTLNNLLNTLEENVAITQHHDAITGTSKQNVTNDYIRLLDQGYSPLLDKTSKILANYTEHKFKESVEYHQCSLNITSNTCKISYEILKNNKTLIVSIYNPSSFYAKIIQIKVPNMKLKVIDEDNIDQLADIICDDYNDTTNCNLFFEAKIPSNTIKHYKIFETINIQQETPNLEQNQSQLGQYEIQNKANSPIISKPILIEETLKINDKRSLTIIPKHINNTSTISGLDFILKVNKVTEYNFTLDYYYYESYYNFNDCNDQPSGAYIFRPFYQYPILYSLYKNGRMFIGKVLIQIQIERNDIVTNIRFYRQDKYLNGAIEIETYLNEIKVGDRGTEIILSIMSPQIKNNNTFYTDSNGLHMQKRILNHRETYNATIDQSISGNYYPITSAIYIEDQNTNKRMTIMNDRSQGGSSLNESQIELMIHRIILHDDYRGLNEILDERDLDGKRITINMKHYLIFTNDEYEGSYTQRYIQYHLDNLPFLLYANSLTMQFIQDNNMKAYDDVFMPNLAYRIPPLTKISIRPYKDKNVVVRLHNMNDKANSVVNLMSNRKDENNNNKQLFILINMLMNKQDNEYHIINIEEVTLNTVMNKEYMLKTKYNWNNALIDKDIDKDYEYLILRPLEIRVFNINYERYKANIYNQEI